MDAGTTAGYEDLDLAYDDVRNKWILSFVWLESYAYIYEMPRDGGSWTYATYDFHQNGFRKTALSTHYANLGFGVIRTLVRGLSRW